MILAAGKNNQELSSDIDIGFTDETGDDAGRFTELKAELDRLRTEKKRGGKTQTVLLSVLVGLTLVGVCLGAAALLMRSDGTTCPAGADSSAHP